MRMGRQAVARGAGPDPDPDPDPELAAIHLHAVAARVEVARFEKDLGLMITTLEDLRKTLDVHRVRAARYFGDEDLALGDLYAPAARDLRIPIRASGTA